MASKLLQVSCRTAPRQTSCRSTSRAADRPLDRSVAQERGSEQAAVAWGGGWRPQGCGRRRWAAWGVGWASWGGGPGRWEALEGGGSRGPCPSSALWEPLAAPADSSHLQVWRVHPEFRMLCMLAERDSKAYRRAESTMGGGGAAPCHLHIKSPMPSLLFLPSTACPHLEPIDWELRLDCRISFSPSPWLLSLGRSWKSSQPCIAYMSGD